MAEKTEGSKELTEAQKIRIERNRLKAKRILELKKLSCHPYAVDAPKKDCVESFIKVGKSRFVDSGGGFLLEEPIVGSAGSGQLKLSQEEVKKTIDSEALDLPPEVEECLECGDAFLDSYLFSNFGYAVCDKCRDPDEAHCLVTRTEAKAEYLLKDCDLDKREPPLRFISGKNPHNAKWGQMKLYLRLQVEKRALEVYGTEEELVKQHEEREEKRTVAKIKKYSRQMTQLRKEVRSSLYKKPTVIYHTHEYGPETYNEDDDTYSHTCECGFVETFEKM